MPRRKKPPQGYDVGYGKPPKSGQFKPGQTGNPNGRPAKASKTTKKYAKDDPFVFANTLIEVRVDGETKQVTRNEAIYNRIFQSAMEGKAWAVKLMQGIFSKANEDWAESYAIWFELESRLDLRRLEQVPRNVQVAINMGRTQFGLPLIAFNDAQRLQMEIDELTADPTILGAELTGPTIDSLRRELHEVRMEAAKKRKWRR